MLSLRWFVVVSAVLLNGCALTDFPGLGPRGTGPTSIVIDLTTQRAYLYRGRTLVLESVASTGREGYATPTGKFRIIEKDVDHRSTLYGEYVQNGMVIVPGVDVRKQPRPPGTTFEGAPMPYFLRIVGGVGMHAGQVPRYPASHGCIRLPNWKAKRFYAEARIGTPVIIRR